MAEVRMLLEGMRVEREEEERRERGEFERRNKALWEVSSVVPPSFLSSTRLQLLELGFALLYSHE